MHTRSLWLAALGLALLFAMRSSPPGVAGQAGMAEPDPAMAAKNEAAPGATLGRIEPMADSDMVTQAKDPVGLVGTIIAVVPLSRTVVVDVPVEKDVLRVGASITAGTIIKAGAAAAPFEADVLHPHPPPYDFHGHLTGDLAYSPEQVQHGWSEAYAFFS